ncbi:hypothetical protein PCL_00829 [Purpureocillium lilacinum]|uniref:Heterokaryon incompatibility domain-containing protein n=1 Tax=Purpureocillium lilacinum TaxID=33203 RepID=A0A2U3DP26_PURLI|nr:hypothetical protein PCL_00829 [Purpureocillium lilacinum]
MSLAGDDNCFGCKARFQEGWSNVAQLRKLAEDGCSYCSLLHRGLHQLDPDVEKRLGRDAKIRFKRGPNQMFVYNDPNGSLGYRPDLSDTELQFEFYREGDNRHNHEPGGNTSSGTSHGRAYRWIRKCTTEHTLCGAGEPSQLPTRIIDIGMHLTEQPSKVWLREPPPELRDRYVALSHCWGGEQPLKTTTGTLNKHKAGIEFSRLPPTFRDAVDIVRRLGIRFVWIDSLCIIQDCEEDWQIEASRMASVYRNSWLTVSATSSPSSSSGCYRRDRSVDVKGVEPDENDPLAVLFPAAMKLRKELRLNLRFNIQHPNLGHERFTSVRANEPFPLLGRAWAYQERLLAPRVLHFGPQELLWECMQDLDCECGSVKWSNAENMGGYMSRNTSGELPPKISHYAAVHMGMSKGQVHDTKRRSKLLSRWAEMVQEYTQRALTFPTDRLPALSGIAAEMAEALEMKYCAGLWQETLPLGLLWQRAHVSDAPPARIQQQVAPSWSWANVNSPIRFLLPLHGPRRKRELAEVYAKVEDVCCVPAGKDERGQLCVEKSYVTLSAEVVEVLLGLPGSARKPWFPIEKAISNVAKVPQEGPYAVKVGKGEPVRFDPDCQLYDKAGIWHWEPDEKLYCAKILRSSNVYYWLALRRVRSDSTYERVGVIESTDAKWKCDGVQHRLKIT